MPDLQAYYGVSAHAISYAIVLFSFFTFLFGPILWQLSDRYGRKWILFLCIVWSFISSLMMCLSQLFWVFLLWRVVNGITGWNMTIIQAMMNDISPSKEERMQNMWLLWALFWMWFIIWPLIGAFILPFWVKAPFWLMTGLAVVEMIMIVFLLSETNKHISREKKIDGNPFRTLLKYFKNKDVSIFLISFFIIISSFSMYQWMFTVFLNKHFWVPWHYAGYVMAGIWLWIAINQAFLLKRFWMKYFSLKQLFIITNIGIFIIFSLLSIINYLPLFLWVFYSLVFFQWVVNPIYQSEIVETAHVSDRWEIMWVLTSLQSMSMFIGPLISGILIDKNISIFMFWAALVLWNILLISRVLAKLK